MLRIQAVLIITKVRWKTLDKCNCSEQPQAEVQFPPFPAEIREPRGKYNQIVQMCLGTMSVSNVVISQTLV